MMNDTKKEQNEIRDLKGFFRKYPGTALAFSGGVDSAYLLYAAAQYAEKVCAYYVKSAFQPAFELEDALRLAGGLGVEMKVIELDLLEDERIMRNGPDRCYYCKRRIFGTILKEAEKDGFSVLLDGTNASDDESDRPGTRAIRELQILSPLRICGLTKEEIRNRSREAGLFTWNKPAYACLATRIPTNMRIEQKLLQRTEKAEAFLSDLGFSDFRIRTTEENGARIQIRAGQEFLFAEKRENIFQNLLQSYAAVCLDSRRR